MKKSVSRLFATFISLFVTSLWGWGNPSIPLEERGARLRNDCDKTGNSTFAHELSGGHVYEAILKLHPAGFWPADEGEGAVLFDRSGNGNDGQIFNLDWDENALLDFNSRFQWVELPSHKIYQSADFSMGGWYFTRRNDYKGGSDVLGAERTSTSSSHAQGLSLFNNAYGPIGSWTRWWGFTKLKEGVGLRLRSSGKGAGCSGALFDVVHGDRGDCLDTALSGLSMPEGVWQHVIYTYRDGIGSLYIDGQLVKRMEGLEYTPANKPFLIGNDMSWWLLYPNGSQSLDGSVSNLVFFDRALESDEVNRLFIGSRPKNTPAVREPYKAQQSHWLRAPGLPGAESPYTPKDRSSIDIACEVLGVESVEALDDEKLEALAVQLRKILDEKGAHFPRVEERHRNSLIMVLLNASKSQERFRELIGEALAKPILQGLDLSREELVGVRLLVEKNDWIGAFDKYNNIRRAHPENGSMLGEFFSQGDMHKDQRVGHHLAYSPVVERAGIKYSIGSGVPWESAEKISLKEYAAAVGSLPEEFRQAAEQWEHANSPNLYRVRIQRTTADGEVQSALLGGPWLIFEGSDQKLRGWSIEIDELGYLHVMGGMHNQPWPTHYIPGSWELMGLSRNKEHEQFPTILYWVSKRPGDISDFEFVGQRNSPRNLPANAMNYMNLVTDRSGVLFLYGRISVQEIWSWGLYCYDATGKRWRAIGGKAADVWRDTIETSGEIFLQRGGRLWEPQPALQEETAFVWAWSPNHYNYIRGWGIRFDPSNRMHVRVPIRGLGAEARILDHQVYAYSDDKGKSFYRADGSPVKLPLTVNPSPKHQADENEIESFYALQLWASLLAPR